MKIVLLCLILAGCAEHAAINGTGYRMTRCVTGDCVRAIAADPSAGPAVNSNNKQCAKDEGCRK